MKALAYVLELAVAIALVPAVRLLRLAGWQPSRVAIVGWWGSETVGDIAILGQLLREIRAETAVLQPQVLSFDAALTRQSLETLRRPEVPVLALGAGSAWSLVSARAVVFGGGPLMESPSLPLWALRAAVARVAGARVVLYANGIGPLRGAMSTAAVASLLRRSTQVALRDATAVQWAARHAPGRVVAQTFDPAFDFVRAECQPAVERQPVLALALRTPPATYLASVDPTVATERFIAVLAESLDALMERHPVELHGIVMHTGVAESDDHIVYASLRARLRYPDRLVVAPGLHRPADAIRTMQRARAALTVRFHAMIFALATETPVVAIDYARPDGKVSAAAADVARGDDVLTWDSVTAEGLTQRLERVLASAPVPAPDLHDATDARRRLLREALA